MIKDYFDLIVKNIDKIKVEREDFFSSKIEESILVALVDEMVFYANAKFKAITSFDYEDFCNEDLDDDAIKKGQETWSSCVKDADVHIIKYAFEKYGIEEKDIFEKRVLCYNLEEINKFLNLNPIENYDAYGSGLYLINNKNIVILSTDDNGSDREGGYITSLCMFDPNTEMFELADVLYNESLYLSDIQNFKKPDYLNNFDIKDFCIKRGWNWKIKDKELHLKTNKDFSFLSSEYKTKDTYRILIKLQ